MVSPKCIGNSFEDEVEWVGAFLQEQQIASFEPCPIPSKTVHGKTFYIKKALPDYVGCNSEGRMLMFEAKCRSTGNKLEIGKGGLKEHQIDKLVYYGSVFKAIAFIIVRLKDLVFWMSWSGVEILKNEGAKSISIADFIKHGRDITPLFNNPKEEMDNYKWMWQ